MEIKRIFTISEGIGVFKGEYAIVETIDGHYYQYCFEYSDREWNDIDDYLDNVKTDFEGNSTIDNFDDGIGLFDKIELTEDDLIEANQM